MVIEIVIAMMVWVLERFLPWSLLVSLALWWGKSRVVFRPSRLVLLLILGMMEDITRIQVLGFRSVLLVSLMMVAWLIARYYQSQQLWWWYLLGIGGELVVMELDGMRFTLVSVVLQVLFLMLLSWWADRFGTKDAIYVQP